MTIFYVSMGSNIEREKHIRAGLNDLYHEFGPLTLSSVFESEAVGFAGAPFYNLVVAANSQLPLEVICQRLRAIEFSHGREVHAKKFAPRTLDLDLLLYGDMVCSLPVKLPRDEILTNAFVLRPLAQIAPTLQLPQQSKTLAALWEAYDNPSQRLTPIPFQWSPPSIKVHLT